MSDFKYQEDDITKIFNKAVSYVFGGKKECKLNKQEFNTLLQFCIGSIDENVMPDAELIESVIDKMNIYGRGIAIRNLIPSEPNYNAGNTDDKRKSNKPDSMQKVDIESISNGSILDKENILDALEEIPRSNLTKKSEVTELLYKLIDLLEWS